jgi:hypothetical protein
MSEGHPDLEAVRDGLQGVVGKLGEVERVLIALRDSLPAPTPGDQEADEGDERSGLAMELRSVIDCVLTDSIRPASRDLQAASLDRGKRGR